MNSDDPLPKTDGAGSTGFLKLTDFFEVAKIYGGLAYLGSIQGSPADRARLRRGDVVLAVNGVPTPDLASFLQARSLRQGGAKVRYVRDGVEKEVDLVWDGAPSMPPAPHVQ
ncbi:MAG TPA: PDZ domain-containing protein [Polyangiaceae bacterium]|jgi:S1-C subfamily serine protease|nr:PDZ domain-containing protein [Polyangiaceae bacterium]